MKPRMTREQAMAALSTMTEEDFVTVVPEDDVDDALVDRLVEAGHRLVGRPSLTAPGRRSPQITLRLSDGEKNRLSQVAARQNRRQSEVVREALTRYLDDEFRSRAELTCVNRK